MSTDSFSSSTSEPGSPGGRRFSVGPSSTDPAESAPVDRKLIQETRDQIRAMVDEITVLSQSECSPAEFHRGFLTRTTSALASVGGAIWSKSDSGLALEYQINLSQTGLAENEPAQMAHGRLLEQLIAAGEPALVQPNSGTAESGDASNPTELLLVVGPLMVEQQVVGLVEIFQRPGAGPTTQRGYLRFLVQMCKVASDFLTNNQLRQYSLQQSMWHRMQSFVRSIHGSLNTEDTVYAIANEGRRVIECDRVSVAIQQGTRMQVQTMSGLDTIERRADQIKKLSRLATTVARGGEPMWYAGDDSHMPPQIERQLHEYLDVSHAKLVVIEPLREVIRQAAEDADDGPTDEPATGRIIGALIAEQLSDNQETPQLRGRIQTVVTHSNDALTNSLTHSNMFLAPLWTWLGKTTAITSARNLPKTLTVLGILALATAVLWLIPYPFTLGANGQLTPELQSEVYADIDGVLQQILIPDDPETIVNQGDLLAVMTNNELMVKIRNLQGQFETAHEEVNKLKRAQHLQMTAVEQRMIEGDLAKALETRDSLQRQLELVVGQAEMLKVRAPASGRIFNWQLRENLLRRPVLKGQNLMTIVHPDTAWQIELEFPERRVFHLMNARQAADEPLQVTFTLASYPGQEFTGHIVNVDNKLDVRSDEGNSVLVRVAFDSQQLPSDLLRSGTRVTAQIHAGHRSLGYVWFHELIETVQSTWLLWF